MTTYAEVQEQATVAFREWASGENAAALATYRHLVAMAELMLARYIQQALALGTCTICEREGFGPEQLDDAARCDSCRP